MTDQWPSPRARADEAERRARAAWSRIAEPDDSDAHRLIDELGAAEALACVSAGDDPSAARYAARIAELDVDRELTVAARIGARVVCPGDTGWPDRVEVLTATRSVPYCLWVRGSLDLAAATVRSAAVVGARAATSYGEHIAAELGAGLADRRFTVISGAAFGIDAAAHRGALAVDGTTVAVLAGGVDRPYPAAHSALLARIADTGAVVAEVPPGSAPTRRRFLQRNRLIAALSRGTVVVEAGLRSGSLNTARTAADLGLVVAAVPGPVTSVTSAGCHELLRSGRAVLVTDAAEAAEAIGDLGFDLAPARRGPARPVDGLDDEQQRVVAALPVHRGVALQRLAVTAGESEAVILSVLGRLELLGFAERHGAGWRCGEVMRRSR